MHSTNKNANIDLINIFVDLIAIILIFSVMMFLLNPVEAGNGISFNYGILFIFYIIFFYNMIILDMYDRTLFTYTDRIIKYILISTIAASSMCFIILNLFNGPAELVPFILIFAGLVFVILSGIRILFVFINKRRTFTKGHQTLIIGDERIIKQFLHYVGQTRLTIKICGYMSMTEYEADDGLDITFLGNVSELKDFLVNSVVDEVIFVIKHNDTDKIKKYVERCERQGKTVRIVPELLEKKIGKMLLYSIGELPVITFHSVNLNMLQKFLKRLLDIFGSLIGLIFTLLISIVIVPAIIIETRGNPFYKQERIGINGRKFSMYKFRTMYKDADKMKKKLEEKNIIPGGLMFKMENDPRVTKIGSFLRRTSLDEFPQFWNVFIGEMSIVGTRPPTTEEYNRYKSFHKRRVSIKTGLTGLWQTSGRSQIKDFDEVVKLDVQYIKEWSLWLDIKIIFRTIGAIFKGHGAY